MQRADSRASSLGPSDSASQQTGSQQFLLDPATERRMEALMELVEAPPTRPSYVLKSVLWDFEDCLDPAEGVVLTEANRNRPRMAFAIRRTDGRLISGQEYRIIHRAAKAISRALVANLLNHPRSAVLVGKSRTKKTFLKYFEPEYYRAVLELEAHSKILRLASAHWKADHMIGQALLNQSDADVDVDVDVDPMAPAAPHLTRSLPNFPSEPSAAFVTHISDVVPVAAKRALEMSPGPKSPSAVHIQKRTKDASIVAGKKSDSECPVHKTRSH